MAENKGNEVFVEGKHIAAALGIPKASKKELAGRRTLQGVHVVGDGKGGCRVESTDSYRVVRIETACFGKPAFGFTVPPETAEEFKDGDLLTFYPADNGLKCKVGRVRKGQYAEWVFDLIDGKYPDIDRLMPERRGIPSECFRPAMTVNADYLAEMAAVVKKVFGKKAAVEVATPELEKLPNGKTAQKPVYMAAHVQDGPYLEMLLMPLAEGKFTMLGKPLATDGLHDENKRLRDEMRALEANVDMWKRKAMEAEERGEHVEDGKAAELEERIAELEAQLKARNAELEEVWKENERLKVAQGAEVEEAEETETGQEEEATVAEETERAAVAVTLEYMKGWCAERGDMVATQKREGCCIWVEGSTKPWQDELNELGFRWGKGRKGWYFDPKRAA